MSDDIIRKAMRLIMDPASPVSKAEIVLDLLKAARITALEEAAKEAECVVAYSTSQAVMRENIAAAIRALKEDSNANKA